MPSIVQSRKPLTPSAQPSHTPRERIRQVEVKGRDWRARQTQAYQCRSCSAMFRER